MTHSKETQDRLDEIRSMVSRCGDELHDDDTAFLLTIVDRQQRAIEVSRNVLMNHRKLWHSNAGICKALTEIEMILNGEK